MVLVLFAVMFLISHCFYLFIYLFLIKISKTHAHWWCHCSQGNTTLVPLRTNDSGYELHRTEAYQCLRTQNLKFETLKIFLAQTIPNLSSSIAHSFAGPTILFTFRRMVNLECLRGMFYARKHTHNFRRTYVQSPWRTGCKGKRTFLTVWLLQRYKDTTYRTINNL